MARRLTVPGFLTGAFLLALLGLFGFGSVNGSAQRIAFSIATGPSGGTYFPVGETIAGIISHPPGIDRCTRPGACGPEGLIATVQTSAGAYGNILAVERGRVDSALAQSDIVAQAVAGSGAFKKPQSHIRAIAALFPEDVHLVVSARSRIAGILHLRGKRVSVGAADSGTAVTARAILSAYRLRVKQTSDAPDIAAQKLQSGKLDAFFFVGGPPVPLVATLLESGHAVLLPIAGAGRKRLLAREKGLLEATIPAGMYANPAAIPTVSVQALWIVSDRAANGTIHAVTRALFNPANREMLNGGPASAHAITRASARRNLTAPLHPGAQAFYRETSGR